MFTIVLYVSIIFITIEIILVCESIRPTARMINEKMTFENYRICVDNLKSSVIKCIKFIKFQNPDIDYSSIYNKVVAAIDEIISSNDSYKTALVNLFGSIDNGKLIIIDSCMYDIEKTIK